MAISAVGSPAGRADTGNITLPTLAQNDVAILLLCAVGTNSIAPSTSGYDELAFLDTGTDETKLWLFAKRMGASPDSVVGLTGVGMGVVYCRRGVDTSNYSDASPVTADLGINGLNGPAITTATDGAEVISALGMGFPGGVGEVIDTPPSGYSDLHYQQWSSPNVVGIAAAWKNKATAGSEDPGAFSGTTAGGYVAAVTWALRPAVVAAGGNSKNMLLMGVG